MTCDHYEPGRWEEELLEDWATGEMYSNGHKWVSGPSLYEDISIGAFKCRGCGHVGYYTGIWREFYERGTPGPCTDTANPRETSAVRQAIAQYQRNATKGGR